MLAAMTIMIRRAEPDDLPTLATLWYEKTLLQADVRLRLAPNARAAWITAQTAHLTTDQRALFVAVSDDVIIGYAAGWLHDLPGMMPAQLGVIDDMALDAHQYHSGAGRALVVALRAWFATHDVQRCVVWLPRADAIGQAFWRSLGAQDWIDGLWLK